VKRPPARSKSEWIDRATLDRLAAEGTDTHPLARGIRRLVVYGLGSPPTVTWNGDEVLIAAEGIHGKLRATSATTEGPALHVKLR